MIDNTIFLNSKNFNYLPDIKVYHSVSYPLYYDKDNYINEEDDKLINNCLSYVRPKHINEILNEKNILEYFRNDLIKIKNKKIKKIIKENILSLDDDNLLKLIKYKNDELICYQLYIFVINIFQKYKLNVFNEEEILNYLENDNLLEYYNNDENYDLIIKIFNKTFLSKPKYEKLNYIRQFIDCYFLFEIIKECCEIIISKHPFEYILLKDKMLLEHILNDNLFDYINNNDNIIVDKDFINIIDYKIISNITKNTFLLKSLYEQKKFILNIFYILNIIDINNMLKY